MDIAWLLALTCAGQFQYQEACKKTTEAALKQSGTYSLMEKVDKESQRLSLIQANNLGITDLLAVGYMADKVYKEKSIGYSFKDPGMLYMKSLDLNTSIKGTGGGLGLHWSLD